jgi:GT2 family glycosyltransferase
MYGEDVDLCKCIAGLGLKVIQARTVAYRHYTGWSVHRLPYQFAAFRFYHQKHSEGLDRALAESALFLGLKARLLCYATIGMLTQREQFKEKARVLRSIDRSWNRLAAPWVGRHAGSDEAALRDRYERD